MSLQDLSWRPVYENGFGSDETLDSFYRFSFGEVVRYNGLAGYIALRSLTNALENVDTLLKTEVQERAVADGLAKMSLQECYYWLAKAESPTPPNRVKTLRTLLADHIE